ncbi:hypothetical protein [Mastigocladopsis repens]|uniref:hypothetical protein n=1 Tax=Mastigocladopsis repens TaxID=221287 RepID=UPI0012EABE41|nr:hypothetical protein [Mastigocladopsis repens]
MTNDTYLLENLLKWESMLKQLFPISIPSTCVWKDKTAIISILNMIGSIESASHVFLPGGGGIDIIEARTSIEDECIEILSDGGIPCILKPSHLIFQSFNNHEWSYFRLETKKLSPIGIYENNKLKREELTELTPGDYVERAVWDYGYYGYVDSNNEEKPLPENARVITRFLEGSFVIFTRSSPYNLSQEKDAYDGFHNLMNSDEFQNYIAEISHSTSSQK